LVITDGTETGAIKEAWRWMEVETVVFFVQYYRDTPYTCGRYLGPEHKRLKKPPFLFGKQPLIVRFISYVQNNPEPLGCFSSSRKLQVSLCAAFIPKNYPGFPSGLLHPED
jgi:hypothetical protein